MAAKRVGSVHIIKGNMNAMQNVRILDEHVKADGLRLCGKQFIMQANNDPKHKSLLATKWLSRNRIKTVEWPSNSADMSPIEHMFHILKKNLRDRVIRSVEEFERILIEEWTYMPSSVTRRLVDSMLRRTEALWKAKGAYTRY
ncbi:MAG: putative Transposable element Tcb1 transposase [Streblomastix strix]|uniref:Putative Transposable element Tcb1 transposase n=1 Tax=Streblomastix strix TaxID=222440 RepID=A0A5J4WIX3_9EUKA|nr:MAG: putative Transposable element Tcb1 transposase [Streblomastix strix]